MSDKPKSRKFLVGFVIVFFVGIGFLWLLGRGSVRTILSGNTYSVGYYDGYIQNVTEKREGLGGLSFIGQMKIGFHGYGSGIDSTKPGQAVQGSLVLNFFEEQIKKDCEQIRGDQLIRCYYREKDIQITGTSKYETLGVLVLPSKGEPIPPFNHKEED